MVTIASVTPPLPDGLTLTVSQWDRLYLRVDNEYSGRVTVLDAASRGMVKIGSGGAWVRPTSRTLRRSEVPLSPGKLEGGWLKLWPDRLITWRDPRAAWPRQAPWPRAVREAPDRIAVLRRWRMSVVVGRTPHLVTGLLVYRPGKKDAD